MSLRTKLVLVIAVLVLALGLGGTFHARLTLSRISSEELDKRTQAIAADLSSHAAELVVAADVFGLYQRVNSLLINNEDMRYAVVFGPDGEVMASTFEGGLPEGLRDANAVAAGQDSSLRRLKTNEGTVVDVAVPLLQGRAGIVRVGVSERGIRSQVNQLTFTLLGLTGIVLGAGTITAYILAFLLTRPLAKLADAARAVGQGDLTRRVAVAGSDEVGRVGAAFNSMAADLDRSRRGLEAAHEQLVRQNVELAALNAVASVVGRSLDVRQVREGALEKVLELMELPAGWVLLPSEEGTFRVAAVRGLAAATGARNGRLLRCACVETMRHSRAALVAQAAECPCFNGRAPVKEAPYRVATPLLARGHVLGVLCAAVGRPEPPTEESRRLLTSIGHYVGVALDNARLYEEVRRKDELHSHLLAKAITAQEEERKRLARELHDESAQALTSLLMRIDSLAASPKLPALTQSHLRQLRQQTEAALEETRRLIQDLRPTALDDLGLVAAIRSYAESHLLGQGVDVHLETAGSIQRLPSGLETTLFRIFQEAINNCARHAQASNLFMRLERDERGIIGIVRDDGVGFDFEAVLNGGSSLPLGLLGMRERATLVGGSLDIWSRPREGTRVSVRLPLPTEV